MSVRTLVVTTVRKVSGKVRALVCVHVVGVIGQYGTACNRRHLYASLRQRHPYIVATLLRIHVNLQSGCCNFVATSLKVATSELQLHCNFPRSCNSPVATSLQLSTKLQMLRCNFVATYNWYCENSLFLYEKTAAESLQNSIVFSLFSPKKQP